MNNLFFKLLKDASKRLDEASIPMDDRLYADENGIHNCSGEIVFQVDSEIFNQVKVDLDTMNLKPEPIRWTLGIDGFKQRSPGMSQIINRIIIDSERNIKLPNLMNVKDVNGNWVTLKRDEFIQIKVFDLSIDEILLLKSEYMNRGGTYPITQESIDKAFSS